MKDSVPRQNTHLKFWPFHKAILKMFVWNFLDPGGKEGIFFLSAGGILMRWVTLPNKH